MQVQIRRLPFLLVTKSKPYFVSHNLEPVDTILIQFQHKIINSGLMQSKASNFFLSWTNMARIGSTVFSKWSTSVFAVVGCAVWVKTGLPPSQTWQLLALSPTNANTAMLGLKLVSSIRWNRWSFSLKFPQDIICKNLSGIIPRQCYLKLNLPRQDCVPQF